VAASALTNEVIHGSERRQPGLLPDPAHRPSPCLIAAQHGGRIRGRQPSSGRGDQRPVSGMPTDPMIPGDLSYRPVRAGDRTGQAITQPG
jgi:hypothetical protein